MTGKRHSKDGFLVQKPTSGFCHKSEIIEMTFLFPGDQLLMLNVLGGSQHVRPTEPLAHCWPKKVKLPRR